ncbi:hypothetical protein [Chitinimonas sp.]|uniref:hypothetical protein n=1 Tax=Chitinimonas sp. TaxID=1934313 RepID=UPI0035B1A19C
MARPRTPTNVLDARGAFKKDPQRGRARAGEPEPNGPIGEPPERLNDSQRDAWAEIVGTAHDGVLCRADRLSVEMAACLLAEFWADPVAFPSGRLARLEGLLGKFGMTPSDRSKVGVPGGKQKTNAFAALLKGAKKVK